MARGENEEQVERQSAPHRRGRRSATQGDLREARGRSSGRSFPALESQRVEARTAEATSPEQPPSEVGPDGMMIWRDRDGLIHREGDLPAVIHADGGQEYFRHGLRHRDDDLPAVVQADGYSRWYRNGIVHREGDLPAIVHSDGSRWWMQQGRYHRDGDLPAIIRADGTQEWRWRGRAHRDGGLPAVIRADGTCEYWNHGVRIDPPVGREAG